MAAETWLLQGVDVSRWIIEQGTVRRPPVSVRRSSVEVPGRHGVIPAGAVVFSEPTVTLRLVCHGSSRLVVESLLDELMVSLAVPGDLTVTYRDAAAAERSATARLVSATPEDVGWSAARVVVVLALPGVFLRGPVVVSSSLVVGTSAVDALSGSTAPVTDAVVRFTGPASSVSIVDVASGTGLTWEGDGLTSGNYLFVDAASLRAWISSSWSQWEPGGMDVSAGVDFPVAGRLQLWPQIVSGDPSERVPSVVVSGAACVIRAKGAFL